MLFLSLGLGGLAMAELLGLRRRFLGRRRHRFVYAVDPARQGAYNALASADWKVQSIQAGPVEQPTLVARGSDDAPWVVYFPGNDLEQLRAGQGVLDALRAKGDLSCLALSYRGFEGTGGLPDVEDIARDVTSAVQDLMRTEAIDGKKLHIVGFSIGGYFAAWVAAQLCLSGRSPASLTLLAPGSDLVMVRPSPFAWFDPGDDYQAAPFLGQITCPTLVLQGAADEAFAGPAVGHATAQQLGTPATYVEYPGVGHTALLKHQPAIEATAEWVTKHRSGG